MSGRIGTRPDVLPGSPAQNFIIEKNHVPLFHKPGLVLNPQDFMKFRNEFRAETVECRHLYFESLRANISSEPVLHGLDRGIGEGKAKDAVCLSVCLKENIAYPKGQDLGFPRSWTGYHHYWSLNRVHRFSLLFIQPLILILKFSAVFLFWF